MKVKITKCSGNGYWYKDCIGGIFDVEKSHFNNNGYWVVENNNVKGRYVDAVDCEIIQEESK